MKLYSSKNTVSFSYQGKILDSVTPTLPDIRLKCHEVLLKFVETSFLRATIKKFLDFHQETAFFYYFLRGMTETLDYLTTFITVCKIKS